jgi:hypothetical protein
MFSHGNIQKYNCTSPDGQNHYQNDHILIYQRQYSNIAHHYDISEKLTVIPGVRIFMVKNASK